jgi:hypothetical protein
MKRKYRLSRIPNAVAVVLLFPLLCGAQVTPGTGGSLRSFESQPGTQPPSKLEIPLPDIPAVIQALAGKVTRFRLTGLTAVSEQEVAAVMSPWTDRNLNHSVRAH